jgi:hypothetical protein
MRDHDTDVDAPGGACAGAMIPACSRFRLTTRTNAGGAARAWSGRFEWPAYDARVATRPTTNTIRATAASASFARAARSRTGANLDPLSPGPESSAVGTTAGELDVSLSGRFRGSRRA